MRVTRPIRYSLYHASDGSWYLGARDWNDASARFNTIQPLAGPFRSPGAGPALSLVRFHRCGAGVAGGAARPRRPRANRPPRSNPWCGPRARLGFERRTARGLGVDLRRGAESAMIRRRGRRGVALVGALALLTISGIVVAALVASSITAQRSTRLVGSDAAALASAEYAASSILAGASAYQLARLPLGVARRFDVMVEQTSELRVDVGVTRLPHGVLWFVADAVLRGLDSSERRINLVAQFPELGPLPAAAIESRGDVSLADDVTVTTDTTGDAECAARPGAPNVAAAEGATVTRVAGRPGGNAKRRGRLGFVFTKSAAAVDTRLGPGCRPRSRRHDDWRWDVRRDSARRRRADDHGLARRDRSRGGDGSNSNIRRTFERHRGLVVGLLRPRARDRSRRVVVALRTVRRGDGSARCRDAAARARSCMGGTLLERAINRVTVITSATDCYLKTGGSCSVGRYCWGR